VEPLAGARRHGGEPLNAEARRPFGLLLLWASVGLLFGAATAPLEHDLFREAAVHHSDEIRMDEIPPPTLLGVGLAAGLGFASLLGGAVLVLAPGRTADVRPGPPRAAVESSETDALPRTCWRCRAAWPASADLCPKCGARRLL